jgi:hypothetical protein
VICSNISSLHIKKHSIETFTILFVIFLHVEQLFVPNQFNLATQKKATFEELLIPFNLD